MRHASLMLSVAAAALLAGQLRAQDTTDGAGTQPAAQDSKKAPVTRRVIREQAQDAESAGPGAQTATDLNDKGGSSSDEIVVSGLRQSLASASAIKRNSDSILDAVVAQDIGKLPDDTAAETLARIAGVQVSRYNDEVNQVLVRGLPNVATSYNGREIFTAELRQVQLQDFPAQALAGIEIYKSGTADLIEPGLAGLVNVRTRRPFDFKGLVVAGGARGTYNDQSRKYDPGGNILLSDRWSTGIGDIGVLVNATYAQSHYHNGVRYNDTYITGASASTIISPASVGTAIRFPNSVGLYNESGKRWRPSGNFSLQWQPNSDLQFYVDGLYQGYRGNTVVDQWYDDLGGSGSAATNPNLPGTPPTLTDVVLVDGTNQVKSLTKTGGVRQQAYRSTAADATNTYQISGGAKWNTGRATLSTDVAYTWSNYHKRAWSLDSALKSPQAVQADFIHDGGVAFSLPGFDASDPNNYVWRGYYESDYKTSGSGYQWRGDLVLDTDPLPFLHKIEAGYRVTTRVADFIQGSRYAYTEPLQIPFASLPIGELALSSNPFRGGAQGFTQYLVPSFAGVEGNQAALRALSRTALEQLIALYPNNNDYKTDLSQYSTDNVQLDPAAAFHAKEQTYATYIQGKYGFDVGSIGIDGVAGLRAVITNGDFSGTSQITLNGVRTETPRTLHQNYVDLLPNASMRIKLSDKLQLRLGYTFTRTKPDFGQLNPALNITQIVRDPSIPVDPNDPNSRIAATGSGGNPNLKPLTSHNYDTSLEYYFSKTGFASVAVFYRDLFGFISNYTRYVNDPTYGFTQLNRPENSGQGRILGAEANFQTFLDFLPEPFGGLGFQGNFTFLNGKNRTPQFDQATNTFIYGPFRPITGLSKWAYNASIFYEKHGITTRLSYNWRSNYVTAYGTDINQRETTNGIGAISRLDFSFSYDVTKRITVSADATNLLAKPFRDYTTDNYGYRYAQDIRDEGRYFGVGFRFKFGE